MLVSGELDKYGLEPEPPMSQEEFLKRYPPRGQPLPPMDLNQAIIQNLRTSDPAEYKRLEHTGELWEYCRSVRDSCTQDARDRMARGQRESEAWRLAIRTIIHELEED